MAIALDLNGIFANMVVQLNTHPQWHYTGSIPVGDAH